MVRVSVKMMVFFFFFDLGLHWLLESDSINSHTWHLLSIEWESH